jgi:hypothetical protein
MADPVLFLLHKSRALSRLLAQFQGKPNFAGVIGPIVDQVQELETVFMDLLTGRYLDNAVGVQLDGLGAIVGEPRADKADDDYRIAIQGRILSNRLHSRIEDLLGLFSFLLPSGAAGWHLREGKEAAFTLSMLEASTATQAAALNQILQRAKGAGIRASLIWSREPVANRFTFAAADTPVDDDTKGWGNDAHTTGGHFADVAG